LVFLTLELAFMPILLLWHARLVGRVRHQGAGPDTEAGRPAFETAQEVPA
jgi:hypothetical protein